MPVGIARASRISLSDRIPESAVFNVNASDFTGSGSTWDSTIGSFSLSHTGDPQQVSSVVNGEPVVRYDGTDDFSRETTTIATGDPISIVYTVASNAPDTSPQHYLDSDVSDDFAHLIDASAGDPHRIISGTAGLDASGDDVDSAFHTFAYTISSTDGTLDRDGTNIITGSTTSAPTLDGLTIAARGDDSNPHSLDVAEVTVLDNPPAQDITDEVDRQMVAYGL